MNLQYQGMEKQRTQSEIAPRNPVADSAAGIGLARIAGR